MPVSKQMTNAWNWWKFAATNVIKNRIEVDNNDTCTYSCFNFFLSNFLYIITSQAVEIGSKNWSPMLNTSWYIALRWRELQTDHANKSKMSHDSWWLSSNIRLAQRLFGAFIQFGDKYFWPKIPLREVPVFYNKKKYPSVRLPFSNPVPIYLRPPVSTYSGLLRIMSTLSVSYTLAPQIEQFRLVFWLLF